LAPRRNIKSIYNKAVIPTKCTLVKQFLYSDLLHVSATLRVSLQGRNTKE